MTSKVRCCQNCHDFYFIIFFGGGGGGGVCLALTTAQTKKNIDIVQALTLERTSSILLFFKLFVDVYFVIVGCEAA